MSKVFYNYTAFVLYGPLSSFTAWITEMHMRQENGETIPPVLPGMEDVYCTEVAEGSPSSPPRNGMYTWMLLRWRSLKVELPSSPGWGGAGTDPSPPQPVGGGWGVWQPVLDRLDGSEKPDVRAEFVHSFDTTTNRSSRSRHRSAHAYEWTNVTNNIMHIRASDGINDHTYDGKDLTHEFIMETKP